MVGSAPSPRPRPHLRRGVKAAPGVTRQAEEGTDQPQMQLDKIHGRSPHPGRGDSLEKEVKPDLSSQDEVGKVVPSTGVQAQDARGQMGATLRRCCCPRCAKEQRERGESVF
ncbi:uncharacterized protein FYW23_011171 [Sylvia borin]